MLDIVTCVNAWDNPWKGMKCHCNPLWLGIHSLQGKHDVAKVLVEVFTVTKLVMFFKKIVTTTSVFHRRGFSGGLNKCSI